MEIGKEITFYYTDKAIKVTGWIYLFDEKSCYVVVSKKIKLNSLVISKNTMFPFLITSMNNSSHN